MWEKFTSGLGKVVQGLLNIFKKKNKTQDWDCVTFTTGEGTCDEVHLGPGKVTIMPLAADQIHWETPVYKIEDKELYERGKRASLSLFEDGISDEELKELENLFSIYLTDWPKVINVPTLIVSSYANQEYESIGVDISQLEETGIAHFWCTTTKTVEECMEEYDLEWEEGEDSNSIIVKDATLLQWEDGHWEWVY